MSGLGSETDGGRIVVANGTVATDYGVLRAHVAIVGERIAGLFTDDDILREADEVIDASGYVVMPGAIDPHSHFEDPGHTEREDFTTGTMSAAAGGYTTVIEHPLTYPPVTTVDLYTSKRDMANQKVMIDFGLWGALTPTSLEHMDGQWREGAMGFKAFIPYSDPSYPNASDDDLLRGMQTAAAKDTLVLVHCENDAILQANRARLKAAGRRDFMAHPESRPPFTEEEAAHRALYIARHAGARLQVVHTSSPETLEVIIAARAAGQNASAEVCPHHLLLDLDDFEKLGPWGCCAPPIRSRTHVDGMWKHVLSGELDSLISDHCAYTIDEKNIGYEDILECPLGCQVIQETVPTVFSEAVHRHGMALDAFARFSSTNAAKIIGIYPRKGTILPGSDADLVLWDLESEWVIDAASQQFSKNPWSPFDGRKLRARVMRTIVRGQTVYADGEFHVEPGYGRFLSSQEFPRTEVPTDLEVSREPVPTGGH
jgi:allantoinase